MWSEIVILCIVTAVSCCQRYPGSPGIKGFKGAPGPAPVPYCKVNPRITAFLRNVRRTRFSYRGRKGRQASTTGWPYNCLHVGLNFKERIFEKPSFECCEKCRFPHFTRCVNNFRRTDGNMRCPSNAFRCISKCYQEKPTCFKNGGLAGKVGKCGIIKKKVGRSYCLERTCIRF